MSTYRGMNMSKKNSYFDKPQRVPNTVSSIHFSPKLKGRELYYAMLGYRRPYGTNTEKLFTKALAKYVGEGLGLPRSEDSLGNIFVKVGTNPSCAFTAHTDTVHSVEGKQTFSIDKMSDHAIVSDANSSCLGADDTSGIIIMMEMMRAKIEGVYCFFVGEEVGGVGSTDAAKRVVAHPKTHPLGTCNKMISFDRRGYDDVITSQAWGECCSLEFAQQLAAQLNYAGLRYRPDDTGIYTDSAEFVDIINECTNISVGYDFEHTVDEFQDLGFLFDYLIPACLKLDTSKMVVKRDPTETTSWSGMGTTPYSFDEPIDNTMDKSTEIMFESCLHEIRSTELAAFFKLHGVSNVDFISYCANNNIINGVL